MCPRKCGPASVHCRRARSERTKNAPLRVPTSKLTGPAAGRGVFLLLDFFGMDVSLSLQSFDPALVEANGDLVERAHALVEPLEHLLGGLHRGAGPGYEFLFPVFAPGADQPGGHLDVALHAQMP